MSVYCFLFSQAFYGLLFSYLTSADVTLYVQLYIINSQFLSCCTFNQIITVDSLLETVLRMPLAQKLTLARFVCLCCYHVIVKDKPPTFI